jgi:hypothetical protein
MREMEFIFPWSCYETLLRICTLCDMWRETLNHITLCTVVVVWNRSIAIYGQQTFGSNIVSQLWCTNARAFTVTTPEIICMKCCLRNSYHSEIEIQETVEVALLLSSGSITYIFIIIITKPLNVSPRSVVDRDLSNSYFHIYLEVNRTSNTGFLFLIVSECHHVRESVWTETKAAIHQIE